MKNTSTIIEAQLREIYGRTVYTHKTHEICADILLERLSHIKLLQIVLSAITTGSLLTTIITSSQAALVVSVIISTVLLILNAYTKDYDLGELAQKHKQSANEIWLIREQYLSLLTDLSSETKDPNQVLIERDRLLATLSTVYAGSPATNNAAYRKAQTALKTSEDMTFSDAEIDSFLPMGLRRGG